MAVAFRQARQSVQHQRRIIPVSLRIRREIFPLFDQHLGDRMRESPLRQRKIMRVRISALAGLILGIETEGNGKSRPGMRRQIVIAFGNHLFRSAARRRQGNIHDFIGIFTRNLAADTDDAIVIGRPVLQPEGGSLRHLRFRYQLDRRRFIRDDRYLPVGDRLPLLLDLDVSAAVKVGLDLEIPPVNGNKVLPQIIRHQYRYTGATPKNMGNKIAVCRHNKGFWRPLILSRYRQKDGGLPRVGGRRDPGRHVRRSGGTSNAGRQGGIQTLTRPRARNDPRRHQQQNDERANTISVSCAHIEAWQTHLEAVDMAAEGPLIKPPKPSR